MAFSRIGHSALISVVTDDSGSKPDQKYMLGGEIGKITWKE
jgi:hypothetical protein